MDTPGNGPLPTLRKQRDGVLMLDPFAEIVGVPVSDPDGLIVSPYNAMPLECRIKKWAPGPTLGRTNALQLIWKVGGVERVADFVVFNEISFAAATFPYSLYVPAHYMMDFDAVIELRYRVVEEGSPDVDSPPRMLRLDRNPPVFVSPSDHPEFVDSNIASSGITESVLANYEFIEIKVPEFLVRERDDQVALYLSDETPPFPLIYDYIQTFHFIDEPLVLRVHRDLFRALPNGRAYMTVRAYDRAGNYSPLSASMDFTVNLIPSPGKLPPPEIRPPAYNDLLLKRDDARAGIAVVIPTQYDGYAPGDAVVVLWQGRPVAETPITGFPFTVPVPWSILRIPGPLMRESVPVQYEIRRAGRPPFPSPVRLFETDFTIAGQDHANAPALLNASLTKVQVFGNGSGLFNELDLRDRIAGASVWVRLFMDPQPGQVLSLYWGNRGPVAYYTVQPGDAYDQLIRFAPDVPGSVVVEEGNHPELPVHYTTSNGVNEQLAPDTLVNVHVDPLIDFPDPEIQHTLHGSVPYLTCTSRPAICHGVRWKVPVAAPMNVGDVIDFFWQGFRANNWSDPIIGTEFQGGLTLMSEHFINGAEIVVLPWETKIEPMRNFASATAKYFVYRDGALLGKSSEGPKGRVRIDRKSPGGDYPCQPGDPGFCDGTDLQWLPAAVDDTRR
ncbi:hypothetical protein [Pseudomonas sp. R3-52-08]|uniref:hypothetical protein n=1 Tax=Pseudomonas sp. R3-52-08 TaxID=1173284 RepID=UPI000F57F6B5|nr:hypothetical protein [Pseudomonas sp. R3-52-08]AZF21049.1 hypothetical protein C4J91_2299 [Pseudomonas sp. R3-52-08]